MKASLIVILAVAALAAVVPAGAAVAAPQAWLTSSDHVQILSSIEPRPATPGNAGSTITIDPTRRYQPIDGFGFTLTGGSAQLLQRMRPDARHALLSELFARDDRGGIGLSWLRISIGSSDMDARVFSYDDLPNGASDPDLAHFSLAADERALIPVLREILTIAPKLPILASPWSPPAWMKTNRQAKGGMLRADMADPFARYLVAYLRGMTAEGVPIDAITLQNEPENANNTPSMLMSAAQQASLIADHVGPALRAAGLATRIIDFDHNCDHPEYPLAVLGDPRAAAFVAGTGFHLYAGDPSAMSLLRKAHPDKPVWLTEQMVIDDPKSGRATPVAAPLARVVIGALTNGAQGVLLWNLAADPNFGPHGQDGACTICEGAVTLDGNRVTRNVAYATIAQLSRFVPRRSMRIGTTSTGASLPDVAFETPTGDIVLVVANPSPAPQPLTVSAGPASASYTLPAGAALTVRWPKSGR